MMQLVPGRHGWSVGDPPAPASQGLAQAALHPATSAPPPVPPAGQAALYPTTMAPPAGQAALYPMTTAPPPVFPAGQQPSLFPPHRAPAALGAPPGEEFFPPQAHAVPADVPTQSEGSIITETSHSDWSSLQGPTTADPDVWSVLSGAPSLVEQEATLGLKHLGEEAEALLLRYLKEFYAVQPDAAEQQPRASLLFRSTINTYIHLSILCYFPKYAPKSSQKFFTVSLPYTAHDVTSRDRLDAIFLPFARYHTSWLLFAFAARNSSLSSFSWHIQEYPYPLFKDVIVILRFECILYRSLLSGKEIFAFLFRYRSYNFSGIPGWFTPQRSLLLPRSTRASSARASARVSLHREPAILP